MTSAWITSTGSGGGEAPAAFIDAVSSVIASTISDSDWRRASQMSCGCMFQSSRAFGASCRTVFASAKPSTLTVGCTAPIAPMPAISVERRLRRPAVGSASCATPNPVGSRTMPVICPGASGASASRSSARSSASTTGPIRPPRAADGSIDSAAAIASAAPPRCNRSSTPRAALSVLTTINRKVTCRAAGAASGACAGSGAAVSCRASAAAAAATARARVWRGIPRIIAARRAPLRRLSQRAVGEQVSR